MYFKVLLVAKQLSPYLILCRFDDCVYLTLKNHDYYLLEKRFVNALVTDYVCDVCTLASVRQTQ